MLHFIFLLLLSMELLLLFSLLSMLLSQMLLMMKKELSLLWPLKLEIVCHEGQPLACQLIESGLIPVGVSGHAGVDLTSLRLLNLIMSPLRHPM